MSEGTIDLVDYGWDESFERTFAEHRGERRVPGRVVLAGGGFSVITEYGELEAVLAGRLRYHASGQHELPAIGDWVVLTRPDGPDDHARIEAVLPRKTHFSRKVAGARTQEQVVAANVDTLLIVMGLDHDYNLRRLERFLANVWNTGAQPVVLLNKLDLVNVAADIEARRVEVEGITLGAAPVLALSARQGRGLEALAPYLLPGKTLALVGSSGAGKSTLINRLAGAELMATGAVREHDARGRHTTSHRQLFRLANGALLIDNPGIRELQLWDADLEGGFEDLAAIAAGCRFSDCRHQGEPGCAVVSAIEEGRLDQGRLESYRALQAELASLERRQDQSAQLAEKRRWRAIHRAQRKHKPRGS